MTCSIYVATHRDSGSSYVGWTKVSLEERIRGHAYSARIGSPNYFPRAVHKHGVAAFDWRVVERFESVGDARAAEVFMIAYLRSLGAHLYNMTAGGEGFTGRHTDEAKAKIRAASTGRRHSPEACAKISQAWNGRVPPPVSDATRAKMSATRTGKKRLRPFGATTIQRMSAAKSGKPWTPARRAAQAARKSPNTAQTSLPFGARDE